jgi:hypothetical protein
VPAVPASTRRLLALLGLALSLAFLVPGLFLPVITIRGALQPAGLAEIAPQLLEQGISDESLAKLRPLLNPTAVAFMDSLPGGFRGALTRQLSGQLAQELRSGSAIVVYDQTRSILGSVKHLYEVGSALAATLILVFSVLVPLLKTLLVTWALFRRDAARRERTARFVEMIAKWSMADVFAVALFIAYLAAQATQAAAGTTSAVLAFDAIFGPGFYWFAAYCLFSLAVQQLTYRWILAAPAPS